MTANNPRKVGLVPLVVAICLAAACTQDSRRSTRQAPAEVLLDVPIAVTAMTVERLAGVPLPIADGIDTEQYEHLDPNPVQLAAEHPVSTFSVDVDTGSYANVRRFLNDGQLPPEDAVRVEELINYFRYDYPAPASGQRPFTVATELATAPWNADRLLLRIGLRGRDVPVDNRPSANLVFLIDVSGSMQDEDKLPLLKRSLHLLAEQLRHRTAAMNCRQ